MNDELDKILEALEIEGEMDADDFGTYHIEGISEAKAAINKLLEKAEKKGYWQGIKVMQEEPQADVHPDIQRLLLKARRDENQWWIDYLDQGMKGKDPSSKAYRVFVHRKKYHRERIAEIERKLMNTDKQLDDLMPAGSAGRPHPDVPKQPDTELDELQRWLEDSFAQFLQADPASVTKLSSPKLVADYTIDRFIAWRDSHTEKKVREARIDELKWLLENHDSENSFGYFIQDHLAQLKNKEENHGTEN